MQTIASTGLRVSEIKYITCEAVRQGQAVIDCKGKIRQIFLPKKLCQMLKKYIKSRNIKSGSLFITKSGKPLDRCAIWKMLKDLCESAGVSKDKVFPHNFRHLFARTFYSLQKDIVRLADILGHSSVETTRLYTMESGTEHIKQLQKLGLLRCWKILKKNRTKPLDKHRMKRVKFIVNKSKKCSFCGAGRIKKHIIRIMQ